MGLVDELQQEVARLRNHLTRLSEASVRVNANLDFRSMLQDVVDSARALTGATYSGIVAMDENEQVQALITSGLTAEGHEEVLRAAGNIEFLEHFLSAAREPFRTSNFTEYIETAGLDSVRLPFVMTSTMFFMVRCARERVVAFLVLGKGEGGTDFTEEDAATLVLFASQAAQVIVNARQYREEQRARLRLETLIETSPVGVVLVDASTGEQLLFNREASRIFESLSPPSETGLNLWDSLTLRRADGREIALAGLTVLDVMLTAEAVRTEEIVLSVPDGRSLRALVNSTPIRSEDGQVDSVVFTIQDLTQFDDLERLRAEFLGMVSHELRTPLTSIKGSTTTLLDSSMNLTAAETQQFHQIIDSQTDRMRALVSDLLDVVHIETGTLSVHPESSDLVNLVDHARNTFMSGGGRRNMDFDMLPDLPPVLADRQRIVQVLTNLMTNAASHSPASSPIRVTATQIELYIELSISDEGRGVPAERLPHLFRKFARGDTDDWGSEYQGSGLGLAICKGIVEAHGGRIWAESDGPGLGARFTFTLPVAGTGIERAHLRSDGLTAAIPSHEERMRVLVVDDDPNTLRYVRDILGKAGYTPIVTGDPRGAVRLMADNDPHLVLLDMMLPGTDGVELMQELLNISIVPVIFLSAYGKDELVAKAFEMGATDYMVKPFSPTELVARIGAALQRQEVIASAQPSEPYLKGDLTIDYAARRATLSGVRVGLTEIEFHMLVELSLDAGYVLTYEQLLKRVWRRGKGADLRPMRTVVKSIRRKLGDNASAPTYLFTEPRVGYLLAKGD